jgi:RNA polymerase sigma factor (sigma-70 family)
MEEIESLIEAAKRSDAKAYTAIVERFADMAYGYAYAILGDFHLAEDAAQEAFVEAYYNLPRLREAAAFPKWFRQIVLHRCNRLTRGKKTATMPLGAAEAVPSKEPSPHRVMENNELKRNIIEAIGSLSQPLREVTTLFYINGYSHSEISEFLDVPVNTVKSRLSSSRKHLKERMINMVKQTFDEHKLPDSFARKVIEGVPRVKYFSGGKNCPESYTFPSCLSACLKSMGEDYGGKEVDVHGDKWRLNSGYVFIMGTSGEAFRLFWKPGWNLDNVGVIGQETEPNEFITRAFEATGYAHRIIYKRENDTKAESQFRKEIIESVRDKDRPVIGLGVIGPPECCIVTGYDEEGDILIGWSYFQGTAEFKTGIDFEPSGYFRKRDWFKDTWAIICIGEKKESPVLRDIYRKAMRWAIELAGRPKINLGGERHNGLSAYKAWSETILNDDDFATDDIGILRERYMAHDNAVGMVAEGRWYGAQFLKPVMECEPDMAAEISKAIECYEAEHGLMWRNWGLVGGIGRSDDKVKKFAEPAVRRQIAEIILEAREKEAEAIRHLELALAK